MTEVREAVSNRLWRLAEELQRPSLPMSRRAAIGAETWQWSPRPLITGLSLDPALSHAITGEVSSDPVVEVWNPEGINPVPALWSAAGEVLWSGEWPPRSQPMPRYSRESKPLTKPLDANTTVVIEALGSVAHYGAVVNSLLGIRSHLTRMAERSPVGVARRTWRPALSVVSDHLADHLSRVPAYLDEVLVPVETWADQHAPIDPVPLGAW